MNPLFATVLCWRQQIANQTTEEFEYVCPLCLQNSTACCTNVSHQGLVPGFVNVTVCSPLTNCSDGDILVAANGGFTCTPFSGGGGCTTCTNGTDGTNGSNSTLQTCVVVPNITLTLQNASICTHPSASVGMVCPGGTTLLQLDTVENIYYCHLDDQDQSLPLEEFCPGEIAVPCALVTLGSSTFIACELCSQPLTPEPCYSCPTNTFNATGLLDPYTSAVCGFETQDGQLGPNVTQPCDPNNNPIDVTVACVLQQVGNGSDIFVYVCSPCLRADADCCTYVTQEELLPTEGEDVIVCSPLEPCADGDTLVAENGGFTCTPPPSSLSICNGTGGMHHMGGDDDGGMQTVCSHDIYNQLDCPVGSLQYEVNPGSFVCRYYNQQQAGPWLAVCSGEFPVACSNVTLSVNVDGSLLTSGIVCPECSCNIANSCTACPIGTTPCTVGYLPIWKRILYVFAATTRSSDRTNGPPNMPRRIRHLDCTLYSCRHESA